MLYLICLFSGMLSVALIALVLAVASAKTPRPVVIWHGMG
jgi:hypothetical protein